MSSTLDPTPLFAANQPNPAVRWEGFPQFNFVGGHNDPEGVPTEQMVSAAARVLERDASLLATYNLASGPQGHRPLRDFVAKKLNDHRGMTIVPDDVLITSGSTQGLDLVNQVFLNAGDTVLVEEHTYAGALTRLRRCGVNIVGVPMDDEGILPERLDAVLDDLRKKSVHPKFCYTIPTVQNPTSAIMSHQRRLDVLSIAREYELLIVEDECYADLVWGLSRPAALHALDQDQRVIHIGSFSKSIAPALRVGYVAAHWNIMRYVLASKTDAGSGALEQMMLAEFCAAHFNEHVKQLNERLERKAHALCDALTYHFGDAAAYTRPKGGIFLWVKFPDLVDSLALQPAAADAGIAFNPGPDWSTNVAASRSAMRLCFANPSIEILQAGVATLADVIATQTGLQLANK